MKDGNTVIKKPANTELRLNINRTLTQKAWAALEKMSRRLAMGFHNAQKIYKAVVNCVPVD